MIKISQNNHYIRKRYLPLIFLFYIVIIYFTSSILRYFFPFQNTANLNNSESSVINVYSITLFYLLAAILEELKYRLLLTKFNNKYVLISISVFFTSIIFQFFDVKVYYIYTDNVYSVLRYFGLFSIGSILCYVILFKAYSKYRINLKRIFEKHTNTIILAQIFLFAIWHIAFSGQAKMDSYVTLFVVHVIHAVFYTWLRINYGIKYSISLHFLYNFILTVLPLILLKLVM